MSGEILFFLMQDGLGNGAIYALLAIAIVLVFAVTRVLFIPQGEFVIFGAFAMASIQAGLPSPLVWLTLVFALLELLADLLEGRKKRVAFSFKRIFVKSGVPMAAVALMYTLPLSELSPYAQAALAIAVVTPLGPQIYRLCYQPVATAPVLVLLVVSIAVHVGLISLSLFMFGPQGAQTKPFLSHDFVIAGWPVSSQIVWVLLLSLALVMAMYWYFVHTRYGKALRATALNRTGARLVGVSPDFSGQTAFFLAALIGACSGVLIAPITPLYYDSGLLIALKGFIAAVIGGMAGYPLAAVGALVVGLLEVFAAFWASLYKEVIVFSLLIPILMWRSRVSKHLEEAE